MISSDGYSAYAVGHDLTFQGAPTTQLSANRVALHESGHAIQYGLDSWGEKLPGGAFVEQWTAAQQKDNRAVSDYGRTDQFEDFAEPQRLYVENLGTPNEATTRAQLPARFAFLDRINKNDGDLYLKARVTGVG